MKSTIYVAAIAVVAAFAPAANATLMGSVALVDSGVNDLLGNGLFDVYHVTVDNSMGDATSASFTFPGNFFTGVGTTFKDTTDLTSGTIGDSFIVLPSGTSPLAALQVDTASLLDVAYTVSGTTPVIPNGSTVVAVLSVPEGVVPDQTMFVGSAVINGDENPILFIPEPSTVLLAGLALVGVATRRRSC